jgi:H+/Cl- antiporter ClcA
MKKTLIIIAALGGATVAYAQDKPAPLIDRDFIFDFVHIAATLLVIYLISTFILQLVRSNFDYRLKSKLVERQAAENIVSQLVQRDKLNPLDTVMQWICTLLSIGVGFLLIQISRPFGLHSLAIMALCVAAGLGLYFIYAKRTKR